MSIIFTRRAKPPCAKTQKFTLNHSIMKYAFALPVFLLISNVAIAQVGQVQQEINRQVWKPFQQSYAQLDPAAFMNLHTGDVIRIIRDNDKILKGQAYAQQVQDNTSAARQRGASRSIDFRFTERFAQGDHAYEAGYYKVVSSYNEGEQYTFYGQFDVILRRENDRWKIMVDADTSKNGSLTEADFLKGEPME